MLPISSRPQCVKMQPCFILLNRETYFNISSLNRWSRDEQILQAQKTTKID